jgi:hypothetical protein
MIFSAGTVRDGTGRRGHRFIPVRGARTPHTNASVAAHIDSANANASTPQSIRSICNPRNTA